MNTLYRHYFAAALLTLFALSACTQLGLQPAQSFDQKLAYAYGVHTAVLQATASAVSAKALTAAEGNQVLSVADQSRALLDAAHAVETTDVSTANAKLALASSILVQLQTYLSQRGVK